MTEGAAMIALGVIPRMASIDAMASASRSTTGTKVSVAVSASIWR
jgi:hypothetical protein